MNQDSLTPKVFSWYDFLTYGLSAIAATVLIGIAQFNGRNSDVIWWRWIGAWTIPVIFWFGYAMLLRWRKNLADRVAYVTRHGLIVVHDGGLVPDKAAVERETSRTLLLWNTVPNVSPDDALEAGVMVFVKPLPFELHGKPGKFAGFTKPHATAIAVGMDGRSLNQTALAHELGHVILRRSGLNASEAELSRIHNEFGVPY